MEILKSKIDQGCTYSVTPEIVSYSPSLNKPKAKRKKGTIFVSKLNTLPPHWILISSFRENRRKTFLINFYDFLEGTLEKIPKHWGENFFIQFYSENNFLWLVILIGKIRKCYLPVCFKIWWSTSFDFNFEPREADISRVDSQKWIFIDGKN